MAKRRLTYFYYAHAGWWKKPFHFNALWDYPTKFADGTRGVKIKITVEEIENE